MRLLIIIIVIIAILQMPISTTGWIWDFISGIPSWVFIVFVLFFLFGSTKRKSTEEDQFAWFNQFPFSIVSPFLSPFFGYENRNMGCLIGIVCWGIIFWKMIRAK